MIGWGSMRWAAVLVALVAACDGTGLDIDIFVPSGTTVDRVEVWVAYDQCTDCPNGIGWTQTARATGDIFYLKDEKLIAAEPRGDRWVLHLDVVPGLGDPRSISFVGFSGDLVTAIKVLPYPHIPMSRVEIWEVTLNPAAPATTDLAPPSDPSLDERAHVWARQPTIDIPRPTGCLVYQKWSGTRWTTEYVVPRSDPDCDGYAIEKECNEFWYQYKPEGSCVSDQIVMSSAMPCVLGVSPCADGVTSDKTCSHEPGGLTSCVPDAICDKCMGQIPAEACAPSAARDAHVANTLFHYDCDVDATNDGTNCLDQHVTVQLPYSTRICGTVAMHSIDKPFSEPQGSLMYGTPPATVKLQAVLRNITANPCVVDIYWFGATALFKPGLLFVLEVAYDNGTRAFYPIEMKTSSITITCSQVVLKSCLPSGPTSDGVTACSRF